MDDMHKKSLNLYLCLLNSGINVGDVFILDKCPYFTSTNSCIRQRTFIYLYIFTLGTYLNFINFSP